MIEFFRAPGLKHPEMLKNSDGKYQAYADLESEAFVHGFLLKLLDNSKSREIVLKMRYDGLDQKESVRTFKQCNFDSLDKIPDITDDNSLNFEYVSCGYKGANQRCPFSKPGDPKPYCIIKNIYQKPVNHE